MYDPGGLVVLAVNNGEDPGRVARVAGERGYRFPVLLDESGAAHRAWDVRYRPTSVVVGPDGRVLAYRIGAHPAEDWRLLGPAGR